MTTHELKTWPIYFERLLSGQKTFEIRKDDRGYQTGDILELREWRPATASTVAVYTGRQLRFTVGFIYRQGAGLDCGEYVVMSLLPEFGKVSHRNSVSGSVSGSVIQAGRVAGPINFGGSA